MIVDEEVLIMNYFLSEVVLVTKFFVHFLYTITTSYQKNQSFLLQERPPIKKNFLLQEQSRTKKKSIQGHPGNEIILCKRKFL